MEKVIIIGSGPAGHTAALYTARATLAPLVIEGLQPGGQLITTTDIENFPGFPEPICGTVLVDQMKQQAQRFGARYQSGQVVAVDFRGRPLKVTLDDGTILESLTVIIATGSSARYLGLASERNLMGHGVSACATCDGALFRGVPVAVVGGGDTAMEEAVFLTRFASRVTIIHRRGEFRASKIMVERVKAHPSIGIVWNSVVDDVKDVARGEVTGVVVRNVVTGEQSELAVTGLFLAIGHNPNTEAFRGQVDLTHEGYVVATRTRTSAPGVFAAGDVQDPVYKQAITAAGTGCQAALEAERFLRNLGQ